MDNDELRINLLAEADVIAKDFAVQLWGATDTASLNEIGKRLKHATKLLIPPPPDSDYVVDIVSNARIAGRKQARDWMKSQSISKCEQPIDDVVRLCKDCRWMGDDNYCMHATSTVTARPDLIRGGLTKPFQVSCETARIGLMNDGCGKEGHHWESKDSSS